MIQLQYVLIIAAITITAITILNTGPSLQKQPAAIQAPTGWKTQGRQILNPLDKPVTLKSISWFGFQTSNLSPHGLWSVNMENLLDLIKSLGFNSLRVPWCNQILQGKSPNGINYSANPKLQGKSSLEVLDYLIQRAAERDLNIILDRHRPNSNGQSELWYSNDVSEELWIQDWKELVDRYYSQANVIGVDLHNEPHASAQWGTGGANYDWRAAAIQCGNAILERNPKLLIIVEGVQFVNGSGYWWGGNLKNARNFLVNLNIQRKVVYSPHDYGPDIYMQEWFKDPNFPNNLPSVWDSFWGYLSKEDIAPIWVGEFGGRNTDYNSNGGKWQNKLVDYIKQNGMHFSYWCLNPNSGDTGGILLDDWQTLDQNQINMLNRLLK